MSASRFGTRRRRTDVDGRDLDRGFGASDLMMQVRRGSALGLLLAGVLGLSGCVINNNRLPGPDSVGVLTTAEGTQYMVLWPCVPDQVESVSLRYVPPGVEVGDHSSTVTVLEYAVDPGVTAAEVFAPLTPDVVPPPAGIHLVSVDEDLLADALVSEPAGVRWDDRFVVDVTLVEPDGSEDRMASSWASTQSEPNTVALDTRVIDNADRRFCGVPMTVTWSIPPEPGG